MEILVRTEYVKSLLEKTLKNYTSQNNNWFTQFLHFFTRFILKRKINKLLQKIRFAERLQQNTITLNNKEITFLSNL